jgi:hypothetical protein
MICKFQKNILNYNNIYHWFGLPKEDHEQLYEWGCIRYNIRPGQSRCWPSFFMTSLSHNNNHIRSHAKIYISENQTYLNKILANMINKENSKVWYFNNNK